MLTKLAEADAILEERISLERGFKTLSGMMGVILAAARSSMFLATARVSTLLKETELNNMSSKEIFFLQGKGNVLKDQTYCTAAMCSGTETGRASILKLPSVMSSLAAILAGTIEFSLALEISTAWSMAVLTPITANVFTATLEAEDICKLHIMTCSTLNSFMCQMLYMYVYLGLISVSS